MSDSTSSVGRSWRTPVKHELLRSFIGQEVGAATYNPDIDRHVWIDLTAGDASEIHGEDWHKTSSPGILAYHAARAQKPVTGLLHEIQPATYSRLIANMDARLPDLGYARVADGIWRLGEQVTIIAINGSGHEVNVDFVNKRDAVMVFNDPNAMTEWAMRDAIAPEIGRKTPWFRCMSTLGCNPAGLKRIGIEERELWFGAVGSLEQASPRHRDLLLAVIERDEAQWAYLLSTAIKWRTQTEKVVQTAFGRTGRTVLMAWARRDAETYERAKKTLFLTKRERGAA